MSKFTSFLKTFIRISFTTLFCGGLACLGVYAIVTSGTSLQKENLNSSTRFATTVYASQGEVINTTHASQEVDIHKVPQHTLTTFIYTEDKRFYSHHGIDYIRIAGATIENIKRRKLAQGGSTISQQLIKNTHLSNEKTLTRKLKEIKLTKQLEHAYTKDEILEMYLNRIYFGNSCYGLAQASEFYFNTNYQNLTLNQSATLAGVINAPSVYDPIAHPENTLHKRNKILKNLQNNNIISEKQYQNEQNKPLGIQVNTSASDDMYLRYVLQEAKNILHVNENMLANQHYKIHTFQDLSLQQQLQKTLHQTRNNLTPSIMAESILINNQTHGVSAYACESYQKNLYKNRMPGSTLKPILVYAPAFELGIASPATIIEDTAYSLNGYQPQNADKTFHGNVSIRNAIIHSYNIPAVKILEKVGIPTAKSYAEKNNISFTEQDIYPSLALGAMQYGTNLASLTNAYSTFANEGTYHSLHFIKSITNPNGKVIYTANPQSHQVISKETSYLLSDCLKDVVQKGTAKKLQPLHLPIYAKTGTAGCANSSNNTDAWCIAYTNNYTVGTWFGSAESIGMPASINGATYPTTHIAKLFETSNTLQKATPLAKPNGIVEISLHTHSLQQGKLAQSSENVPERYTIKEIFSKKYTPKSVDATYAKQPSQTTLQAVQENEQTKFSFFGNKNTTYTLQLPNKETIFTAQGSDAIITFLYPNPKTKEVVTYTLYEQKSDEEYSSPQAISQIKMLY